MKRRLLMMLSLLMVSVNTMAHYYAPSRGSYGYIANNMLGPIGGITELVQTAALLCGIGLIIGSMFKYHAYRRNPFEVTVGVPFVMLLAGIGCLILGLIHYTSF